MKFTSGVYELDFEDNAQYPATRELEKMQAVERGAEGTVHVETFGIRKQRRTLVFELMQQTDYDAFMNWFDNIADGAKNTFDFEDEKGNIGEVRFISTTLTMDETDFNSYSGKVVLEYV